FNQEVISERTKEQLDQLTSSVVEQIKKIEEATKNNDFPTNVGPLCNYCLYRHLCPAFKNVL
nr:PD-(D/E)XK nuclease family protein [Candidatus Pacearchaeota archaeon]